MTAHAMNCPSCGAPVTFRSKHCAYCRGPLAFEGMPTLKRGKAARLFDLKQGIILPGSTGTPVPGKGLDFSITSTVYRGMIPPAMSGSAVSMRAVCHDAFSFFAVGIRTHGIGDVMLGYRVYLRPAYKDYRVVRAAGWQKGVLMDEILGYRASTEIAGVGTPNELEIRCSDSVFEILINGKRVGGFEDAHYGYGEHAWYAGAANVPNGTTARVTIESYEVYEVDS